ncbi:hypothetical protein VTK73DRAFT_1921 [Phialemonium thermophilum]|uniref:C2H2-type domain-containing protein n=1 Tax=Phialemonium thermophilum TaxID=223376 RepID=A0ABR3Y256_9PEZI
MVNFSTTPAKKSQYPVGQVSSPPKSGRTNPRISASTIRSTNVEGLVQSEASHDKHLSSVCKPTVSTPSTTKINTSVAKLRATLESPVSSEDSCSSPESSGRGSPGSDSCPTTPEPDWSHLSGIERRKQELVECGMAIFTQAFDALRARTLGSAETPSASGSSRGSRYSGNKSSQVSLVGGQKRHLSEDNEDDANEDNLGGRDNNNKRTKNSPREQRLYACPYYKHDPDKYKLVRTCCGPGWESLHRLKEHLYRKHQEPKHICHRCYKPFEDEGVLRGHLRADKPCFIQNENPFVDMFSIETEKKLRVRSRAKEDAEKWKEIYGILFPGEPVPSPFHDENDLTYQGGKGKYAASSIEELDERFSRDCLPLVRRRLEELVEERLNSMKGEVMSTALELVRDLFMGKGTRRLASRSTAAVGLTVTRRQSTPPSGPETPSTSAGRGSLTPTASPLPKPADLIDTDVASTFLLDQPLGLPEFDEDILREVIEGGNLYQSLAETVDIPLNRGLVDPRSLQLLPEFYTN